jgi:hypothetical protein
MSAVEVHIVRPSSTSFTMLSWAHDAEGGPGDGIARIGSRARKRVRR